LKLFFENQHYNIKSSFFFSPSHSFSLEVVMTNQKPINLLATPTVAALLLLLGCGGDNTIPVTGVTINPSTLSLGIDGTASITASVHPLNASDAAVTWSLDARCVSLEADGLTATVTGFNPGTATITATSQADSSKSASCIVTVGEGTPTTLAAYLEWLQTNAQSNTQYSYTLNADESIEPTNLSFSGRFNVGLRLVGAGAERTLNLLSNGAMFTIENGITLTLGNNVTLQGRDGNDAPLVRSGPGGTLVMEDGSVIRGNDNNNNYQYGGGVIVEAGAFDMHGGAISGNKAYIGGGVKVMSGAFNMCGGTISGNSANEGGGVSVSEGAFIMRDGTISSNTASYGGGVSVGNRASFTMHGGTISGNTANNAGGGVIVYTITASVHGTFRIADGTIYGSYAAMPSLGNIAPLGAALAVCSGGIAQCGTFNDAWVWVSSDDLDTTYNTIHVVNGVLQ
jgi:hypothetical protein